MITDKLGGVNRLYIYIEDNCKIYDDAGPTIEKLIKSTSGWNYVGSYHDVQIRTTTNDDDDDDDDYKKKGNKKQTGTPFFFFCISFPLKI